MVEKDKEERGKCTLPRKEDMVRSRTTTQQFARRAEEERLTHFGQIVVLIREAIIPAPPRCQEGYDPVRCSPGHSRR